MRHGYALCMDRVTRATSLTVAGRCRVQELNETTAMISNNRELSGHINPWSNHDRFTQHMVAWS